MFPTSTFPKKDNVTDIGDYVFQHSITHKSFIRKIAKISVEKYGIRNLAILYPNSRYGVKSTNIFWDEILERGGRIVGAQTYDRKSKNFSGPIRRLNGTFYIEDRKEEYTALVKKWLEKKRSSRGQYSL